MHDLSFKTSVKNIDVRREKDRFTGTAGGDSRMTNDVSRLAAPGRAVPLVPIQEKRIPVATSALPTQDVSLPLWP